MIPSEPPQKRRRTFTGAEDEGADEEPATNRDHSSMALASKGTNYAGSARVPTAAAQAAAFRGSELDEEPPCMDVPERAVGFSDLPTANVFKNDDLNSYMAEHNAVEGGKASGKMTKERRPSSGGSPSSSGESPVDPAELPQYHCDSCKRDITHAFRVRCAECADFDLCVDCFCRGVETDSHKSTHSYIPIRRNNFPLFDPNWTAEEELMLIEGVSKFGFGNWNEVADLVAPFSLVPKKLTDCEHHYYSVYISNAGHRPAESWMSQADRARLLTAAGGRGSPVLSGGNAKFGDEKGSAASAGAGVNAAATSSSTSCNVVGYMPLRGDFDNEYDNDAELIIADMEFRGDEPPQERELKLKVLEIYNCKLDDRVLRKRVVIEKGLSDWRKLQLLERKRTKEENDLHTFLRPLIRFDGGVGYEELVRLVIGERRIVERLRCLQEWMSLGLKSHEEVQAYEMSKTQNGLYRWRDSTALQLATPLGAGSNLMKQVDDERAEGYLLNAPAARQDGLQQQYQYQQPAPHTPAFPPSPSWKLEAPAAAYPGAHFLTEKELQFCDELQIPPIYYELIKDTLLRYVSEAKLNENNNVSDLHCTTGPSSRLMDIDTLRLDATRMNSLYEFVIHTELNLPAHCPPATAPVFKNLGCTPRSSVSSPTANKKGSGNKSMKVSLGPVGDGSGMPSISKND